MIRPQRKAYRPERLKDLSGKALEVILRVESNHERHTVENEILAQLAIREQATKLLIERLPKV